MTDAKIQWLLDELWKLFSKEYESVTVHGEPWFISNTGTVFRFIVLVQLQSLIVEYADDVHAAERYMTDDGDQIDVDQNISEVISEIRAELKRESIMSQMRGGS